MSDTLFALVGSLVVLAILWPWVVYVGVRQWWDEMKEKNIKLGLPFYAMWLLLAGIGASGVAMLWGMVANDVALLLISAIGFGLSESLARYSLDQWRKSNWLGLYDWEKERILAEAFPLPEEQPNGH